MHAAVYKGESVVSVEEVPTPEIGAGELLVRVEACGSLPHRSEEDRIRSAGAAAHLRA